jgi:hypothetical protein
MSVPRHFRTNRDPTLTALGCFTYRLSLRMSNGNHKDQHQETIRESQLAPSALSETPSGPQLISDSSLSRNDLLDKMASGEIVGGCQILW